jgi:hypothetical protein
MFPLPTTKYRLSWTAQACLRLVLCMTNSAFAPYKSSTMRSRTSATTTPILRPGSSVVG